MEFFIDVAMATLWSWAYKKMLLHGGHDSARLKNRIQRIKIYLSKVDLWLSSESRKHEKY